MGLRNTGAHSKNTDDGMAADPRADCASVGCRTPRQLRGTVLEEAAARKRIFSWPPLAITEIFPAGKAAPPLQAPQRPGPVTHHDKPKASSRRQPRYPLLLSHLIFIFEKPSFRAGSFVLSTLLFAASPHTSHVAATLRSAERGRPQTFKKPCTPTL